MLGRDEVTERRACRVLGQARNTQRRKASVATYAMALAGLACGGYSLFRRRRAR
jgi:hypothetical protein